MEKKSLVICIIISLIFACLSGYVAYKSAIKNFQISLDNKTKTLKEEIMNEYTKNLTDGLLQEIIDEIEAKMETEDQNQASNVSFKTLAQSLYKASEQQYIIDSMSDKDGKGYSCYTNMSNQNGKTIDLSFDSETMYYAVLMNDNGTVNSLKLLDTNLELFAYLDDSRSQSDIVIETNTNKKVDDIICD